MIQHCIYYANFQATTTVISFSDVASELVFRYIFRSIIVAQIWHAFTLQLQLNNAMRLMYVLKCILSIYTPQKPLIYADLN